VANTGGFSEIALMTPFPLRAEHITLAQAVKAVGLAGSGGQAKHLVRSGTVTVNGTVELQPGRKLFPGDRFRGGGEDEWLVEPQAEASGPR
jgi:ribosome-associated protein